MQPRRTVPLRSWPLRSWPLFALAAALFLAANPTASRAEDASPEAAARRAGLDPAKLGQIRARMEQFVAEKVVSGVVAVVGRKGGVANLATVGQRDLEKKLPMEKDTVFRIASMTKPITAIAILMLEEDGKLSTTDTVEKHLPEFRGQMLVQSGSGDTVTLARPQRPITLRDLLTHTSGMPGGPPPGLAELYARRARTLAEAVLAFSQRPLEFEPGSRWSYCNAGIDTLGRVVEVAAGKSYEAFLAERLFAPLGMNDTVFFLNAARRERLAVLYESKDGALKETASFLGDGMGKYPLPAGGLFSTAPDLARLHQMLLNGGALDGRRYLTEASLAKMTRLETGTAAAAFTPGMGFGLGVAVVREPSGVTAMLSPGSYGHGGAFGTQGWIDPGKDMFFILLIQRAGLPNADASELRRELQALAVAAIGG